MGVRKLNKFLISRETIIPYRNIPDFVNKLKNAGDEHNNAHNNKIIIAIDFWLYAHKFLHSCKSDNVILGFWNQIMKFFSCGAIPLYVMDGSVPLEKQEKVDERTKKRTLCKKKIDELNDQIGEYVNLNDLPSEPNDDKELNMLLNQKNKLQKKIKRVKINDLHNIYKMFDALEVPYVKAEYEADSLCAKLFKENIITACLSDDMDMLALGCGSTIKFHEGQFIEFNLQKIKQDLGFDQDQFIDLCIMFGCDYLHHPFRINCDEVYDMIKKHGSLLDALFSNEHEIFNMSNNNVNVIGEHYYRVKNIYLHNYKNETIPLQMYNIKMKHINFDLLLSFIKKSKIFEITPANLQMLEENINVVNRMIADNIM